MSEFSPSWDDSKSPGAQLHFVMAGPAPPFYCPVLLEKRAGSMGYYTYKFYPCQDPGWCDPYSAGRKINCCQDGWRLFSTWVVVSFLFFVLLASYCSQVVVSLGGWRDFPFSKRRVGCLLRFRKGGGLTARSTYHVTYHVKHY